MPISYSIDRVRRRLNAVATGFVSYSEVVAHLGKERDDSGLPLQEFIDATQATAAFSASELRQIVAHLRNLGLHNALGPTAVVTGNNVSYGMMQMMEMLVEDVCDVRPFLDRREAEEWLNIIRMPRPPAQEG